MAQRSTGGRVRAFLFLSLSVASASVASLAVYGVIAGYQDQIERVGERPETVPVLVAARDLGQGRAIEDADLRLVDLPPAYVPEGVLRTSDQAVGRVPRERILGHEFIRDERLADPAAGLGLTAIIPRGLRALSLNVADGSAVSGFVSPGNYVDVLVTLKGDDGRAAETVTLLQAATVLGVDGRLGDEPGADDGKGRGKPAVTLALTPDQSEQLTHALAQGEVTLTLRNDIDVTHLATHGAVATDLLGADPAARLTIRQWNEQSATHDEILIIRGPTGTSERVPTGR